MVLFLCRELRSWKKDEVVWRLALHCRYPKQGTPPAANHREAIPCPLQRPAPSFFSTGHQGLPMVTIWQRHGRTSRISRREERKEGKEDPQTSNRSPPLSACRGRSNARDLRHVWSSLPPRSPSGSPPALLRTSLLHWP